MKSPEKKCIFKVVYNTCKIHNNKCKKLNINVKKKKEKTMPPIKIMSDCLVTQNFSTL